MRTAYDVLKDTAAVNNFPITVEGGWATFEVPELGDDMVSVTLGDTVFTVMDYVDSEGEVSGYSWEHIEVAHGIENLIDCGGGDSEEGLIRALESARFSPATR